MFGYKKWRKSRIEELVRDSEIYQTSKGDIETYHRGNEPYILVFHGAGGGWNCHFAAEPLEKMGFGIASFSRPGYLRTPLKTGVTYEEQADVIPEMLDMMGIEKVVAYGISAGGPSALQFAARHPTRVQALMLTNAITKAYEFQMIAPIITTLSSLPIGSWFAIKMLDYFTRSYVKKSLKVASTYSSEEIEQITTNIMESPEKIKHLNRILVATIPLDLRREGLLNDLKQINNFNDIPLEKVICPTFLAYGTKDGLVPIEQAKYTVGKIPNIEYHKIEGAYHAVSLTDGYKEFRQRQRDFLQKHISFLKKKESGRDKFVSIK